VQTEPGNIRYRGWRESKRLVEVAKSVPCDLKKITAGCQAIENSYVTTQALVDTLSQQVVSQIQHARSQIFYRLKKDSG
jgi:predicted RNA-binding protein with EMAP domain